MLHLSRGLSKRTRGVALVLVVCAFAACARVDDSAHAASLATVGHEVVDTFEVDILPQPVPIARVTGDGVLYLLDILQSELVAYSTDGRFLWRTRVAPGQMKSSPIALDVDARGHVLVLESYAVTVHEFTPAGQFVRAVSLKEQFGRDLVPRTSGILAVHGPDQLTLLAAGPNAIRQLDAQGTVARSFGSPMNSVTAKAGAWVRVVGDIVYHRRADSVTFEIHGVNGGLLRTITPLAIPYVSRGTAVPGDQVFTTDILPDGRIICEIVHRTPYEAIERGLRTVVRLAEYIIDDGGQAAVMLPRRIGQLASAAPDGYLYFLETRASVKPGQVPKVRRVSID